ncbi:hypothetical protein K438DRAFT_1970667 [Mycena galopus ATCC 62051]|nr:hypothetical protein K438DRAFT_1970667 [Mycena galopus ATCC 62051]
MNGVQQRLKKRGGAVFLPPSYATDSLDPSSTSSESRSEFSCTSRYEFYDDNNFELHESLSFWSLSTRRYNLHGPLSFFVDYLAMVGQVFPVDSDIETPNRRQVRRRPHRYPYSLDLTLPAERPTASPTLADSASQMENGGGCCGALGAGTRNANTQTEKRAEARKAAGMADERAVRLMAGVRLAVLEALQRVEDMVWHRYGITEFAFPDKLIRHPFLHPLEAAKLQVLWHILQRNGRDNLADAVHEILSIRLHKDYAVSAFFNAASLDESYPERDWDYWHLLGKETLSPSTSAITTSTARTRDRWEDSRSMITVLGLVTTSRAAISTAPGPSLLPSLSVKTPPSPSDTNAAGNYYALGSGNHS